MTDKAQGISQGSESQATREQMATSLTPLSPSSAAQRSTITPSESSLLRELAIVSLVVVPLLTLPFLPLRKRLGRISAHMSEMKSITQTALRQASLAQDRDLTLLESVRADLARYKVSTDAQLGEIKVAQMLLSEQHAKADAREERLQGDIKKLREEVQTLSNVFHTTVKQDGHRLSPQVIEEIAGSFVDVAAFIEEVETMEGLERRGIDPRGVDKMRRLAMNLHATANGSPRL